MLLEYVMTLLLLLLMGLTTNIANRHKLNTNVFAYASTTQRPPALAAASSQQQQYQQQQHHQQQQHQHQHHHGEEQQQQHHLSNIILDSYESLEPHFENTTEREVIAAVGTTARLHCRVRNLGDRAVSWIRQRDLHILTIGIMTYTNDQRFLARHIDNSDEWVLKVVSVQPRDAGIYECQVSTEPKISQAYKLMVVTSKAQILANRELFIQSGSDINLTCIAPQAPGPYTHMLWYKDSELINDSPRGGIRVVSEQQMKTSNLVISRVLHTDSGNYTCAADNSNSDSVFVHIIKSEQHAAMQHELGARIQVPRLLLVLLTFFYNESSNEIGFPLALIKSQIISNKVVDGIVWHVA